jgi:hypothetical protein
MSKKVLFKLHGFEVLKDSIYLVVDKPDYDAPSAFIERRVTKLPSDGVGVSFQAPYKRITNSMGVWDTGFDEMSPCYAGIAESVKKEIVKGLVQNVVEPYQKLVGDSNALLSNNDEFYLKMNWEVHEGKVFKTSDPVDVVALYFALLSRELSPKDRKDDPAFLSSAYMIIDVNDNVRKRDEAASLEFEAIGLFEQIYQNDKKQLNQILFYLGRNVDENIKISALRSLFKAYLAGGPSNTEAFLNLVKECNTEKGLTKINVYHMLKTNFGRNPKLSKAEGMIYYNDVQIGPDLKSAANNIAVNPQLDQIKKEIMFFE